MKSSGNAPAPSAGLRRFLYVTAFVTGAAILVVEILGAKMLSPFVGSSHFVWTAQIAVTLLSLALGYYFGGWLVDRSPKLSRLYLCIAIAALYLGVTVPAVESVAYAFLDLNLAAGALLTSLFLFLVPLTLLAATGPFLIRVLTLNLETVGGQVGRLSAISTVGSVLGTILIGYVILPFLPNSVTMFATAGVLLALGVVYFVGWARDEKSLLTNSAVIAVLLAGLGAITAKMQAEPKRMDRLFMGNSNYGELQVLQIKGGPQRYYLNDYLWQNTYDSEQKLSLSVFTYMIHELAWAYHGRLTNALCIGMGVGIVPNALHKEGVNVDVVEINPAIVPVAKKFFDFDPNIKVTIGDGRFFVNKARTHYDAIILDAFLGDSSPSHLMTREAFSEMARLLGQSGVLTINSFGDFRPGRDFFVASLDKTLRSVFKDVRIHASGRGNVFFVASNSEMKFKPRENVRLARSAALEADYSAALREAPRPDPARGIILTDDYNPVEFYDALNREEHRRALAKNVRDL